MSATRAREIRAELGKLAPYPAEGPVKAQDLARYLAMEAQVMFARYMDASHDPSLTGVVALQGFYAAACALLSWAEADVTRGEADECAEDIRDAFESGGMIPEWVYENLGSDAGRINDLARELAVLGAEARTQKPAASAGVLVDPEDLRTLMRLAEDYAGRDPLHLPPNDSCREALGRLSAAAEVTGSG